jgi:hypothetical protein
MDGIVYTSLAYKNNRSIVRSKGLYNSDLNFKMDSQRPEDIFDLNETMTIFKLTNHISKFKLEVHIRRQSRSRMACRRGNQRRGI